MSTWKLEEKEEEEESPSCEAAGLCLSWAKCVTALEGIRIMWKDPQC